MELSRHAPDWAAVLALIAADLEVVASSLRRVDHTVRHFAAETRLRFNAPTAVEAWGIALTLATTDGRRYVGEVELFHWLIDGEWELCESSLSRDVAAERG